MQQPHCTPTCRARAARLAPRAWTRAHTRHPRRASQSVAAPSRVMAASPAASADPPPTWRTFTGGMVAGAVVLGLVQAGRRGAWLPRAAATVRRCWQPRTRAHCSTTHGGAGCGRDSAHVGGGSYAQSGPAPCAPASGLRDAPGVGSNAPVAVRAVRRVRQWFGSRGGSKSMTPLEDGVDVGFRDRLFPRRIVLVRHGQSEGNTNKLLFASIPDWKQRLTAEGRRQAHRAGAALREVLGDERVAFFVSPYNRTKETYEEIARSFDAEQCVVMYEPRLREQEWGMFQHPKHSELIRIERERVGHFYYRFPRGESGADVYDRVSTFMDSVNRCYRHDPVRFDNVVLVSHGLTTRLFLMRFFHWDVETFESIFNFEPAGFVVMERQPDLSYRLTTPLTTSDPDSIAPFFADSVHPIYQPQAPWKQKILAEEAHMREHAVHAAAPLDGVTQHVGGPSDVPTPMHAPASAGGAGEAAADASHAMVTPPVLQLRDDHAIVDPRLHAPAVKPRPEPSHPRGGASTRGRGAAAPTDNHIVS